MRSAWISLCCSMSLTPSQPRVRGHSHIDFKTATTGVAAKSMRNELSKLVNTVQDAQTKKVRPHRAAIPPN